MKDKTNASTLTVSPGHLLLLGDIIQALENNLVTHYLFTKKYLFFYGQTAENIPMK